MDVTNIKSMKGHAVVVASGRFWISSLTVLLCFSKLSDDRNTEEFLSSELNCQWDGFFLSEFDVPNAA
jgi:hypothetical protein